jgi:hypothetical protein
MPKNQQKKLRVKTRAIGRVSYNNFEEIKRILEMLKTASSDERERYKIARVELCTGGTFQLALSDNKIIRARCPGNGALEEYIKQYAKGTSTCEELQPLVLVLIPELSAQKQGSEVLGIINNNECMNKTEILQSFKYLGILWEKKLNKIDDIFITDLNENNEEFHEESDEDSEIKINNTKYNEDDDHDIDINDL